MILDDLYLHNALCYREHPAIIYGERTITYGEYHSRSKRLANALAAGGLKRADRIAILSQNCPEYVELHGASGISGFIAVGINYRLAAPEQAQILTDCEPAVFVFESEYAERAAERYGVEAADILTEVGRRGYVGGQEDMIIGVALDLARQETAA